jgi:hypothetical protein
MSSYKYPTITKLGPPTKRGLGKSDSATVEALFPDSPGLSIADSNEFKKKALELLLKGEVVENLQAGTVDRDFGANASSESRRPPNLINVETGAGGLPASPYLPNPMSPGAGSSNPADQAQAPEGFGTRVTNSLANDGNSTDATTPSRNPYESSKRMSHGSEELPLVPGKSPATANAS